MFNVTANGADIPALGFGVFRVDAGDTRRMVKHVLDIGYRHIDTAQAYNNEADVGEGITASGVARADIFLTTKVWVKNFRHANFLKSVDDSLGKLQTDYVDLLLLHWPNNDVPLAEQIGALNEVRQKGQTRHIGVSNYNRALIAEAVKLSAAPLVTNQIEYHPYLDQTPVLDAARAAGMSVTAYYAMADGKVPQDAILQAIGKKYGKSAAQVTLRWLIQQKGVVALSKTVSEARARENLAIFDFELSAEDMAAIHKLANPKGRIVSPLGLAPAWDAA
ncbi:aldo/keto reductase [Dongia sp.]|uniref:aldo/keto reductase n=1 Tax=Dongia sp. TaxID=1977262 RepID=UPI0035B14A4D